MQHLTSVIWSLDNKYVLSASDEMNIRIWKANASEKLGTVSYSCEFKLLCIVALRLESHLAVVVMVLSPVIELLGWDPIWWLKCEGFPAKYIFFFFVMQSVNC